MPYILVHFTWDPTSEAGILKDSHFQGDIADHKSDTCIYVTSPHNHIMIHDQKESKRTNMKQKNQKKPNERNRKEPKSEDW